LNSSSLALLGALLADILADLFDSVCSRQLLGLLALALSALILLVQLDLINQILRVSRDASI
jgi:hypothetical protein